MADYGQTRVNYCEPHAVQLSMVHYYVLLLLPGEWVLR